MPTPQSAPSGGVRWYHRRRGKGGSEAVDRLEGKGARDEKTDLQALWGRGGGGGQTPSRFRKTLRGQGGKGRGWSGEGTPPSEGEHVQGARERRQRTGDEPPRRAEGDGSVNGAARGGSHLLCLPGDGEGAGAGRTGAVLPQGSEETALVRGAGQELPDTPGHSMPSAPGTTLQLAGRGRHSRPEGPGDRLWPLRVVSL